MRSSWELFRQLDNDPGSLWIVLGDFNEITSFFEKKERSTLVRTTNGRFS